MNANLLFFSVLLAPIFVGFRSGEVVFDVNVFAPADFPSVPVGLFFLFFPDFLKALIKSPRFVLCLVFLVFSVLIVMSTGLYKGGAYLVAVVAGGLAFVAGRVTTNRLAFDVVARNFSLSLILVVATKLVTDLLRGEIFSDFFVFEWMKIYNFYDYFPLIFLLLAVSSVLVANRIISWVAVVLSLCVFVTHSRFYQVAVLGFYFLYFIRFYRFSFPVIFIFGFVTVIFVTLFTGLFFSISNDVSLHERFQHWNKFFYSFSAVDILMPFLNPYRFDLIGSFHNELLDFYSYFGVLTGLIFYVLYKIFSGVSVDSRAAIKVFLIVMMSGLLVQNNLSHLWSSILIFFTLGAFSSRRSMKFT